MTCPDCTLPVPEHVDRCPSCSRDVGFPNVRAARRPDEASELDRRHREAESAAEARGARAAFDRFREAVRGSVAVLNRPLGEVQRLASGDNQLYATFHQLVQGEARLPDDNAFDRHRLAVDALLFPNYHQQIRFAALSLDGRGPGSYGGYTLVLKTPMIENRATAFEENSFLFCRRRAVPATGPFPAGHRAAWADRDRLAAAKLHDRLEADTPDPDFAGILMRAGDSTAEDDFVEVHVYGPIHRRGIERVAGQRPARRADQVILDDLRRKLAEVGVALEVRP